LGQTLALSGDGRLAHAAPDAPGQFFQQVLALKRRPRLAQESKLFGFGVAP